MPKVTFSPFIAGHIPTGEEVFDYLYSIPEAGTPDSCSVLNGWLDADNFDKIGRRQVDFNSLQRNATSGGKSVCGTAHIDYFSPVQSRTESEPATDGWFNGVSAPETASANNFIAIPGGSVQFYLPYKAFVLLTWQVCWTNDSNGTERESHIRLFVDDKRVGLDETEKDNSCNVRRVRRTQWPADYESSDASVKFNFLRGRYKSRYWSGHQWLPLPGRTPLSKGFHSASLRVIQDQDVKQTRVRIRSLKYIFFKASDD